jgi:hypothetical protein
VAPPEPAPSASGRTIILKSVPPAAEVTVGGERRGRTPLKLALTHGQHLVYLSSGPTMREVVVDVAAEGPSSWCYKFDNETLYLDSCP